MASFIPPVVHLPTSTTVTTVTTVATTRTTPTTTPHPSSHAHAHPSTAHATPPPIAAPSAPPKVLWFRDDLRLHDHPALHSLTRSTPPHPIAALLLLPRSPTRFWCDAARDLRRSLRARGAALHIRAACRGVPRAVADFVDEVGACGIAFHAAVLRERRAEEDGVVGVLRKRGVVVDKLFTGALHEPHELPFSVGDMPEDCDRFGLLMEGVSIGEPLAAPGGVWSVCGHDEGVIPLGEGAGGGGESVGLARLREYVGGKGLADVRDGMGIDTKFGRFGRLLNVGCVSPRRFWHEVVVGCGGGRSLRRWCAEMELKLRSFVVFATLKTGALPGWCVERGVGGGEGGGLGAG